MTRTRATALLGELGLLTLGLVVVLGWPDYDRVQVVLGLVGVAALTVRHRFPQLALVLALPSFVVGTGLVAALAALFAVGRRVRPPWVVVAWVLVAAAAFNLQNVLLGRVPTWFQWLPTLLFTAGVTAGPAAVGALRTTQLRLAESVVLLQRARSGEIAAREESARAQERARIAREVHDAVGHDVALLALEAGVLETTSSDPDVRAAAARMRSRARSAMDEVRSALGLHEPAPPAEEVSGAKVQELVRRARAAGMTVDLALDPDGGGDDPLAALAPGVQRAAVRVLQEALTNAVKHAPGAAVAVRVEHEQGALRLTVGSGPARSAVVAGVSTGGTGLTGLGERLRVLGGELDVQRGADGGYRLVARLPVARVPEVVPADRP